jgi:hypothetical protein
LVFIAGNVAEFQTGSSKDLGLPVDIQYHKTSEGTLFFSLDGSLEVLCLKQVVKEQGFKKLDTFLVEQGVEEAFKYEGIRRKLIKYEAFVSLLMGFCGYRSKIPDGKREMVIMLRKFVLKNIHSAAVTQITTPARPPLLSIHLNLS